MHNKLNSLLSPRSCIKTSFHQTLVPQQHLHAGGPENFMLTPLEELAQQIAAGKLHVQVGKVFHLDDIVEAHRCMESNQAGGKIVVLT